MKIFTSLVAIILLVAVNGCGSNSSTTPPVSKDVVGTVNSFLLLPVAVADASEPSAIETINMDKSETSEPTSI